MLPSLLAQVLPEPSVVDLGGLIVKAATDKNYALLGSALVLAAVWLARWGGAKAWPWLATPRGGATLLALGGTSALLVAALAAGQPFSLGLLLGCISTALGGAGLWSTAKNATQPAQVGPVCSAADIANKKPGCV